MSRIDAKHGIRVLAVALLVTLAALLLAATANAAVPTVTVAPSSGVPGAALTVSGSGWHAGDQIFVQIGSASFDNDVACVLVAHQNGTIAGDGASAGCQVPNAPAGSRSLTAIDAQSSSTVAHGANFTISPTLVLMPTNASAGTPVSAGNTVSIVGHGFAAGSTVSTFKFDATTVTPTPSSVTTDANGNFSAPVTLTVPAAATAGDHTVSARDAASNTGSATQHVFHATVAVTPASGAPGAPLTVSGGGWPAGDQVFVQIGSSSFDSNVACVLKASASGAIHGDQFNAGCQVPSAPNGSQPFVAIDQQNPGVVAHGANFAVGATLILTPVNASAGAPVSPGTTVSVAGHGFAPSSTVSTFKFDNAVVATSPASIATDANGNFATSVTFSVPAAATAGNHTVSATDAAAKTGSASQRVFRATVVVTPTTGVPGAPLKVSGGGWPAGDTIFVQIGSTSFDNNVACTLKANSSGAIAGDQFDGSCVVPNAAAGSEPLVAIDQQNPGIVAHGTNFTVKPTLVLTPSGESAGGPASPGATVSIAGHGFAAGATVATFKFDAAVVAASPSSVITDSNGNFTTTVTFTVPATASAANHTVSASDGTNTGTATLHVFRATVSATPTSGVPGAPLTVAGAGWPPGDTIFVQIGSSSFDTDVACVLKADGSGAIAGDQFDASCVVPNAPAGSEALVAIDQQNLGVAAHGANFTVKPTLVLTPSGESAGGPASPGTTVTISGHGFGAAVAVSTFKFDAAVVATSPSSVVTDSNGSFTTTVTFMVPATASAANHTVSASDGTNSGNATLHVFRPTVVVSPTSGAAGAALAVSGSGWPAGDTIFVQIGSSSFDSDVVCTLKADLTGKISGDQASNGCKVPSVSSGSQPLVAIDQQNLGVVANGANFTVT